MKHRTCLWIMPLSVILLNVSCTKYTGMYSDILNEKRKCERNCSKETNNTMRIQCYTKEIEKNPDNSELYFKRGETYRAIFKYTRAISDFIKVVELEPGNKNAYYAVATTASLALKNDYALQWLEKALESGFNNFQRIETDPSLDNIRKTRQFKSLIEKWRYKLSSAM